MERKILWMVFIIACIAETKYTTLPLILDVLIVWYIARRDKSVIPVAFLSGVLLDILSVRPLGLSSFFLISAVGCVMLYERKFELQSVPFIFIFSLISTLVFMSLFFSLSVLFAVINSLFVVLLFILLFSFVKCISHKHVSSSLV